LKKITILLLALSLVLLTTQLGCAQTNEDMKALRNDVQELKKGQEAIKKDIEEIKALLQRTAGGPPPAPKEVKVSTDDDPFLGKKTAKLTVIEFSDYQ
jgi:protein-disulfide isomerase